MRPEGPLCNSHDRKVVVTVLKMSRRSEGPAWIHVGPSGLDLLNEDVNPDLTVGAIAWRRFAPHAAFRKPAEQALKLATG